MYAAVVTSFDTPPHYSQFDEPLAAGETRAVVDVLAAGLHPRVRSQADGSHYTSTGELPLIPGIDGVGRLPVSPVSAPLSDIEHVWTAPTLPGRRVVITPCHG